MNKNQRDDLAKYLFLATVAILVIISFFIIKPYIIPLISAFVLAYLIRPLYFKMSKSINKHLSAIICTFLILLIIIAPLGLIIGGVTQQANAALSDTNMKILFEGLSSNNLIQKLNIDLESVRVQTVELIISTLSSAASHLPSILISLIITVLGIYYILVRWESLAKSLERYLPFRDKKQVRQDISKATNSIIYGSLVLAFLESIIAGIGFFIIGVDGYLISAALIFFLAFIPGLGPTIIWVPLAIYYFIFGNVAISIGIVIIGLILSFGIDIILRGKVLGKGSNIHPLLMLVGILGGISLFGIFGFIIGPLILVYTLELLEEALTKN
jgi:predicted PurR-regulated permease PerM